MKAPPILVIDDDVSIAEMVEAFLSANGYKVTVASDGDTALQLLRTRDFPVILSDIYIDRITGLDVLREARARDERAAVILMTARGSVRTTVEAEREGAFDYLAKPFDMASLLRVVEKALEARAAETSTELATEPDFGGMIGYSPAMVEVYKKIARSARSEETVLIVGETGVGKELVARSIHENSARCSKAFCAVDSGAIPGTLWEAEIFGAVKGAYTGADREHRGIAEIAAGGTIFFDEVGEIPLEFQPKLLRFLQEKEYRPVGASAMRKADVRVVAATNRNPEQMIAEGTFRPDLYYRLNVLRIDVPPLRERREDIEFLAKRFLSDALAQTSKHIDLDPGALEALRAHTWPGNVRELRNTIYRLVAMNPPGRITAHDLRLALTAQATDTDENPSDELDAVERQQIRKILEQTGGNKTRAAEILGIQRRTLYKKLARMEKE